jgi:hypothetical protein
MSAAAIHRRPRTLLARAAVAAAALLGVCGGLAAQEQPAPAPASEQKAAPPAQKAPPAPADKPADASAPTPKPAAGAEAGQANEPQRGIVKDDEFIPTQELQPDEDVTFPVDI